MDFTLNYSLKIRIRVLWTLHQHASSPYLSKTLQNPGLMMTLDRLTQSLFITLWDQSLVISTGTYFRQNTVSLE